MSRTPTGEDPRQVLWAPWRMDWILSDKPGGCALCRKLDEGAELDPLIVHAGPEAIVCMNKYPYGSGHLLVYPRRHCADLLELDATERSALEDALHHALRAVREALNPEGVNLGMNLGEAAGAGIPGHLHWHLVPRWSGDTNFLSVVADVRSMPEHLRDTHARIKACW